MDRDKTSTEATTTDNISLSLDLGERRHSYCVRDDEGEIFAEDQIVNTRECREAICRRGSSRSGRG